MATRTDNSTGAHWPDSPAITRFRSRRYRRGNFADRAVSPYLYFFQLSRATEPRDRLYGFLGLIDFHLVPDYTLNAEVLFTQTTVKLIEETGHLASLSYAAELTLERSLNHVLGLEPTKPTWALQLPEEKEGNVIRYPWNSNISLGNDVEPKTPF
ncbi:hypothetical protein BX600DRAFT_73537 [Xylariales sp. PMI_506]|nr:hypothetical protein BX600DRAFT_73537 [Xylariales sp. PMI_506]